MTRSPRCSGWPPVADDDERTPAFVYAVTYSYSLPGGIGFGQLRVACSAPLDTWDEFCKLPQTIRETCRREGSYVPAQPGVLTVLPLRGDWR